MRTGRGLVAHVAIDLLKVLTGSGDITDGLLTILTDDILGYFAGNRADVRAAILGSLERLIRAQAGIERRTGSGTTVECPTGDCGSDGTRSRRDRNLAYGNNLDTYAIQLLLKSL